MNIRALVVGLAFPLCLVAQGPAQLPSTAPACFTDLTAQVQRTMNGRVPTTELMRQVANERRDYAKRCAAAFDTPAIAPNHLLALANLYQAAEDTSSAHAVLERAYRSAALSPAERGDVIVALIAARTADTLNTAHDARLELLVKEADALPDAASLQRMRAHAGAMYYYYKISDAADAPDNAIRHAMWIIDRFGTLSPDVRRSLGLTPVSAFANAATRLGDRGDTKGAIALLQRGQKEVADAPNAASLATVLHRYEMVGTIAPPLTAARWLNMPAGTTELKFTAPVTVLEFSAHWCGPCKQTYPGLNRLRDRFGAQGLQVVLATELYGYYRSEWNLTPEDEFARTSSDFEHAGITAPVAVDSPTRPTRRDGPNTTHSGVNTRNFAVSAIPQIHIIDRDGRIRYTLLGFQEAVVTKLVAGLLAER